MLNLHYTVFHTLICCLVTVLKGLTLYILNLLNQSQIPSEGTTHREMERESIHTSIKNGIKYSFIVFLFLRERDTDRGGEVV